MGVRPGGRSCPGGPFCRVPAPPCYFLPSFLHGLPHSPRHRSPGPGPPALLHEAMGLSLPGTSIPVSPRLQQLPWPLVVLRAHPGSRPQRSCRPLGLCLATRAWPPESLWPGVLSRPTVLCRLWAPPPGGTHPPRLAHPVQVLGADLLNGRKCRSALQPPREMRAQHHRCEVWTGLSCNLGRSVCLRESSASLHLGRPLWVELRTHSQAASHLELGALSFAGGLCSLP